MVADLRSHSRFLLLVLATLLLFLPWAALAEVRLEVSPRSGASNEHFTLSVVIDSTEEVGPPVLSQSEDFNVQYIGPQSSVSIINGTVNKRVAFNYRLIPRKEGKLQTPAAQVEVGGKTLQLKSLQVQVAPPSTPRPDTVPGVRLHQSIEPKSLYIGQQAALTIELETAINLIDPQFVDLSYDGFWSETIAENERSSKVVRGDQYDIVRFRKALFPLRTGSISIPPRRLKTRVRDFKRNRAFPFDNLDPFDVDIFDQFFGRGALKEITVESNPLVVEVQALPPQPSALPLWGLSTPIVGETTLSISVPEGRMKVGETKTAEITVVTTGSLSALKGAEIKAPPGLKVYEDAPETKNFESGGALMSRKTFRVSLVPLHGGQIHIPPLELGYFDTTEEKYHIAKSQEILLEVEGPPAEPSPHAAPSRAKESRPAPPPTSSLVYEEESMLERLSARVSPSFALLVAVTLGLMLLLIRFASRRLSAGSAERHSLEKIDQANSVTELNQAFRSHLGFKLQQSNGTELGTEQLRALLPKAAPSKEALFQLHAVLDALDTALYAPNAKSDLATLRQRARDAARML